MIGAHGINFKAFRFYKEKKSLVNHYKHKGVVPKWKTLEIRWKLFLQVTHLAIGSALGSVHNMKHGQ